ncbi:cell wall-active antibiotics response protein [Mucilaginibacter roseus]|uniref:Cell wall-active antibiotics response protein n=1 Tax=Mucilaginibacter roseus TaxID=1528868 RepID=A0ABS8U884_9SPHI|nr:LiaF domain-containing protein [Mucilaginibacter roseus]MCD8741848.1 cell wall-active antibiotics response protein [Mucilaginibacter roseus]
MSNNIEYKKQPRNGKAIAGVILLMLGGVLLIRQLDIMLFPGWLFSWPLWLIIPGLYIGARSNFQKSSWFVLVGLGLAFMANEALDSYNIDGSGVIWPVMFIAFGIWMILRRNNKHDAAEWEKFNRGSKKQPVDFGAPTSTPPPFTPEPVVDYRITPEPEQPVIAEQPKTETPNEPFTVKGKVYTDDVLDATALFGGVDKIVFSKDFRGGEIVNIFGGSEIDMSRADIKGHVMIEVTQVFGATKLIVPPHWHVISDVSAVFAGVDDKRMRHTTTISNDKVLIIKGVSIFAGIEIRSF